MIEHSSEPQLSSRCDLYLDGGVVITLDQERTVIDPGAVAIADQRILAVGPSQEMMSYRAEAVRIIDCAGKVVMPGLVDGHTHLFQILGRGLGDGLSLVPWLQEFMFPYSKAVTSEMAVAGARLGALQAALSGTTTVVDNHYAPTDTATTLAVAGAIEEVGIRGAVARGVFGPTNRGAELMGVDPALFTWTAEEELAITSECLDERPSGSRVEVWPCPENIVYVEPDLVSACAELAEEAGVCWHMHCAEAQDEIRFFETMHGIRPVAWLAKEGLLGVRTSLAHAIWLEPDEIRAMGQHRVTAVHNPISNQYLASGVLPLGSLLAAGANVALGSDGSSVAGQDIFEAMKSGVLLHRVDSRDPTVTSVEQFLELATLSGAAMTQFDIGTLSPGAFADLVVLDVAKVRHTPWNRAVASVVHAARSEDVEAVVVGGELIVEKGRSTKVDQDEVMAQASAAARQLIHDADLGGLTKNWY